jgi:acetyl-CoA carboxylase biotin carboxyl carrier protein
MNFIDTVDGLAEVLNKRKLAVIGIKCDDFEIRVVSGQYAPVAPINQPPVITPMGDTVVSELKPLEKNYPIEAENVNFIKSPIVGTFYASPAPEKPPFVKVGDKVVKGQVVCIIESMKLMNEINSDFDGTVTEILVKDGEAVDFNKDLFRLS